MKLFPQPIIEKLAELLRLQRSRRYCGLVGRTEAMKEKIGPFGSGSVPTYEV
ncbi:hypothetical protein EV658_11511 [Phaeovulum veldkampii DSM 11550]|jgi:hypothetical protein|nr:hypothetical protein EV658_11511 [Phaeovulum veldkampii DSM 11550]